jgi:hypothetical protein
MFVLDGLLDGSLVWLLRDLDPVVVPGNPPPWVAERRGREPEAKGEPEQAERALSGAVGSDRTGGQRNGRVGACLGPWQW